MLMMLFLTAQGIVPYIQVKSYQLCYGVLRFEALPDTCQASRRSGSRQSWPCIEAELHEGYPWMEGEVPSKSLPCSLAMVAMAR